MMQDGSGGSDPRHPPAAASMRRCLAFLTLAAVAWAQWIVLPCETGGQMTHGSDEAASTHFYAAGPHCHEASGPVSGEPLAPYGQEDAERDGCPMAMTCNAASVRPSSASVRQLPAVSIPVRHFTCAAPAAVARVVDPPPPRRSV